MTRSSPAMSFKLIDLCPTRSRRNPGFRAFRPGKPNRWNRVDLCGRDKALQLVPNRFVSMGSSESLRPIFVAARGAKERLTRQHTFGNFPTETCAPEPALHNLSEI